MARFLSWAMTLSGLATGLMLVVVLAYFGFYALGGGLQTDLATDAPPQWALTEAEVMAALLVLYVVAAVAFTVSLALVQLWIGPWWVVVGGMCAWLAGGALLVVGSQATEASYQAIDRVAFIGFAGYMVATNWVGLRARQVDAVPAGAGVLAALLPLIATVPGGLAGAGIFAAALVLYGIWAVWLAISARRRPAPVPEPLQPALQSGPGDRYNSPVPPTGRFRAP